MVVGTWEAMPMLTVTYGPTDDAPCTRAISWIRWRMRPAMARAASGSVPESTATNSSPP